MDRPSAQTEGAAPFRDAAAYLTDIYQRSVLVLDVLRKRGNIYLDHIRSGQPPVLQFDYETIRSGRDQPRPVNYDLVRIIPDPAEPARSDRRPVVIIDPRAGHGPGIGGSKRDSEVGFALKNGHPVYFILFHPEPMRGQTLADVEAAEAEFIAEVARRHPDVGDPAVIGNCQAGWAVALLGAGRPELTGPMVLSGAPLSYWAGVRGRNPMRYRGGTVGGIWITSLLTDIGNGTFDGAHLVANFEDLNPANTYWKKRYNLFANVDTEEKRFLDFEKWWSGYFLMTAEEIRFIVDRLFVGNQLQDGTLALSEGQRVDLKNLEDPVLVLASEGDNITPPQQALNWIIRTYGTVEEIKRCGQVIVYRVHEDVGHLGIFVSGRVARKEHREIIGSLELVEYLSPGLYEMVIEDTGKKAGITDYQVRFEERTIADLERYDDGTEDEAAFRPAAEISRTLDAYYQLFVSPWVRMAVTEPVAEATRQLHPLRTGRYLLSDLNPFLAPVTQLAEAIRADRRPVPADNPYFQVQELISDTIISAFDLYRDIRDDAVESAFYAIYDNPFIHALFPEPAPETPSAPSGERGRSPAPAANDGGYAEGAIRAMVAMAGADRILDRVELETYVEILREDPRLRDLTVPAFKARVKEQAGIIADDLDRAIATLPDLLPGDEERVDAINIAKRIAFSDGFFADEERILLNKLQEALGLEAQPEAQ